MNKLLCLSLGVMSSLALISQEAVHINHKMNAAPLIDGTPLIQSHHELEATNSSHERANDGEAETIFLGTSGNIYTALLPGNNQVSFNPNVNVVGFAHRSNGALTGVMEFDYSIDGGASWEVNQGPLSPSFADGTETGLLNGLRYPNGVVWAPEGSTSSDDAYIFSNGPALDTEAGSWGNLFEVSSKLDGSNVAENYINYAVDSLLGNPTDFHPYSTSLVGDAIYSLSTQFNNSGDAGNDTLTNDKFYLTKSTFDDGTNSFVTEVANIFEPNWVINDNGDGTFSNFFQHYSMAWDPSGQIGYVVLVGVIESEFGFEPIPKPNVWKTTDAGDSWFTLQEFDFQTLDNIQNTLPDANGGDVVRPYFTTIDTAVDADGELHLFTHMLSGFTNHPDSTGFIYGSITALEDAPTEFLFHCQTDGDTNWEADLISEIINSDSADEFVLGNPGVALSFKPQISRTPDGSKIFFSYHKSFSSLNLTEANIFARGYDIATDIYASEKNLTENTDYEDFTFFQTMSPISIVNGECAQYELPIVFLEPGADDLSECQHIYLHGAGFDDINFDPTSVEEFETRLELEIYPNPSNGAFVLNLPRDSRGTVQVFDITGKIVYEAQNQIGAISLDLSAQNAGSYTVRFSNDNQVITSAIVIR